MADGNEVVGSSTDSVRKKRATRVLSWGVLIGAVVVSYAVFTNVWPQVFHRISGEHAVAEAAKLAAATNVPINPFASAHGQQLVVYFFTASDCGWSRVLENHKTIRSLRTDLSSTHGAQYEQVTVVGVDLDKDLDKGLTFLSQIGNGSITGAFDQVIVGGSWFNDQVVRLAWQSKVIRPALPQILAVERDVSTESYVSTHAIGVGADRILAAVAGQNQITDWVKRGYPLDNSGEGGSAGASSK